MKNTTAMADYELRHIEALRKDLAGCTVLLKKDGSFPLEKPCTLAAYGSGVRRTIRGGTGSGEVNSRYIVTIEEGLQQAGFTLTGMEWHTGYEQAREKAHKAFLKQLKKDAKAARQNFILYGMGKVMPEPEYDLPLNAEGDAAIYVVSRISGEGNDRTPLKGDIRLTDSEVRDILALDKKFTRFMLVLNVGGVVDLSPVMSVRNILLLSQLGVETGCALADILLGKANPSGKLTTTWAPFEEYPEMPDFEDMNETRYREGIYVGYRFYETRYVDNTTGICDEAAYAKAVQYPFGYGLSYTTFEQSITDYKTTDSAIEMTVEVKNTGAVAGKDVVQVYYTAPYTTGGIEKSHVVLAGFAKTSLLQPGASEKVTITFAPEDMASYDETGAKAYVLDAGTYQIKLMNNAHEVIDQREYEVPATITYSGDNARSTDLVAATNEFEDVAQGQIKQYVSRADWQGTLPTARTDGRTASAETVAAKENAPIYENNDSDQPITIADHGLTLEDMTGLDYDDPKWNDLLEQLSVDDMATMIANGGWSTPEITSVGKPATNDLDGPAGINSLVSSLKGVSFPSEVIVGSSWNTDLAQRFGTAFGAEAAANHVVGPVCPRHEHPPYSLLRP